MEEGSFSVIRFIGSTTYMLIRLFAGSEDILELGYDTRDMDTRMKKLFWSIL